MKTRTIVTLAGLAAAVYGTRRALAMHLAMAQVAPELRSPVLPLTARSLSERSLRMGRLDMRRGANPGAGVTMTEAFESGRLARELDAVVVSPDYRLAPEHPFPAALDDCMAALRWMRDRADELGIDADRIAVAGSSAGGGLSAAVARRSTDEGISLRAQVLVYPMMDDRTALRDDHGGRGQFMWTPASSRWAWTAYLGREPQESGAPEYAAPARRTDLSGLPPAWLGVGDLDILYDEGVAYAERLKAHGVPCELVAVTGMYHGADGIKPKVPAMRAFRQGMAEHLRNYL